MSTLKEQIMEELRKVIDPEIGLNVVDLGMIRDITLEGEKAKIKMVLTAPFCPLAGYLTESVRQAALGVEGVSEAEVTVLDEPWNPEWMLKRE
ncbi:MAG: FeS assembly SUF system protein [Chloroflexi bacterium]|nr:MAG: FeS assembly SUF system protein [Chloroflexota bacterium]